jgi:hypothetical protein
MRHKRHEGILALGYLWQVMVDQMVRKGAAFNMLHPKLVKRCLGRFVAVKSVVGVDNDTDLETLALRIHTRFYTEDNTESKFRYYHC